MPARCEGNEGEAMEPAIGFLDDLLMGLGSSDRWKRRHIYGVFAYLRKSSRNRAEPPAIAGIVRFLGKSCRYGRIRRAAETYVGKCGESPRNFTKLVSGRTRTTDLASVVYFCPVASFIETRSFWTTFVAPVLLQDRLPEPYFRHFLDFVRLVNICLKFEMARSDIQVIRTGFIAWVKRYEE
jgi:hypothetical protein